MKKIIIALLVLTVCLSLFACGSKEETKATGSTTATFFSLEELVNDPEFQKGDMTSVVLTGASAVEFFVVEFTEPLTALRILPNPFLEAFFDNILFIPYPLLYLYYIRNRRKS